jgi:hypothetical protein
MPRVSLQSQVEDSKMDVVSNSVEESHKPLPQQCKLVTLHLDVT